MAVSERVLRVDRIRERMAALDLDQAHLGEKCNLTGGAVSRLMNTGSCVVGSLWAICRALDCSADYLIGLDDTPKRSASGASFGNALPEAMEFFDSIPHGVQRKLLVVSRALAQDEVFPAVDERRREPVAAGSRSGFWSREAVQ